MATVLARRAARSDARGSGRAGRLAGLGALLAALALLVALPVAFVGLQAIFPALNQGSFAHPFAAVKATLDEAGTWPLLGNTLRFGLAVAAGSLALGVPLGALRGLVRLPGARLWDLLFLAPFLIPPYLGALGWMLLLQPNGYLQQLVGIELGGFLFSFPGIATAMTLSVFPVVYFSVSRAMMQTGGRLAQVARVCGATPWRAFLRVTLPLAAPAIAASALLAFTMAIEEFGIPSALGARAGFSLLVTSIEARFSDWPIDLPGAAVLSSLLALTALLAFYAQRRLLAGTRFRRAQRQAGERRARRAGPLAPADPAAAVRAGGDRHQRRTDRRHHRHRLPAHALGRPARGQPDARAFRRDHLGRRRRRRARHQPRAGRRHRAADRRARFPVRLGGGQDAHAGTRRARRADPAAARDARHRDRRGPDPGLEPAVLARHALQQLGDPAALLCLPAAALPGALRERARCGRSAAVSRRRRACTAPRPRACCGASCCRSRRRRRWPPR